jgi:O-antigen ligase
MLLLVTGAAAIAVGLGMGYVATLEVPTSRLIVLVLGALAIPVLLLNIELGSLVFLGFLWSWASDVAIKIYGAPSLALPFGLGMAGAFAVLELINGRRIGFDLLKPLWLVAPYFGVAVASVVLTRFSGITSPFAPGPVETLNLLVRDLVVFWLLTVLLGHSRRLKAAAGTLVVVAGLLSVVSLHQYVTGNFGSNYGGFAQSAVLHIVGTIEDPRLGGPLNSPNYFALSLIYTVPLALAMLRTRLDPAMRLLFAAILAATVVTILLTFSRGGAVILGIVVLISLTRHRIGVPHLTVAALGLAVAVTVMPVTVWERLATITDPFLETRRAGITIDTSVELRIAAQEAAVQMFAASPFLGVGAGNYPPMYQEFCRRDMLFCPFEVFWAHNLYLEVLAETGVIGLCTYLGTIAAAMIALRRSGRLVTGNDQEDHDFRELAFGLELAMWAYLLGGLQIHGSYPRYFWMLLALCVVAGRRLSEVMAASPATSQPHVHSVTDTRLVSVKHGAQPVHGMMAPPPAGPVGAPRDRGLRPEGGFGPW